MVKPVDFHVRHRWWVVTAEGKIAPPGFPLTSIIGENCPWSCLPMSLQGLQGLEARPIADNGSSISLIELLCELSIQ